jgi:hypothetical protein
MIDKGISVESLQARFSPGAWTVIHATAVSTQKADERTLALLMHALACLPVLVLGFLFQEGARFPHATVYRLSILKRYKVKPQ